MSRRELCSAALLIRSRWGWIPDRAQQRRRLAVRRHIASVGTRGRLVW